MRFFSALMPRETRFFALFDRHGALIAEGGHAMVELLDDVVPSTRRPPSATSVHKGPRRGRASCADNPWPG